jgi:hypothetical protein
MFWVWWGSGSPCIDQTDRLDALRFSNMAIIVLSQVYLGPWLANLIAGSSITPKDEQSTLGDASEQLVWSHWWTHGTEATVMCAFVGKMMNLFPMPKQVSFIRLFILENFTNNHKIVLLSLLHLNTLRNAVVLDNLDEFRVAKRIRIMAQCHDGNHKDVQIDWFVVFCSEVESKAAVNDNNYHLHG